MLAPELITKVRRILDNPHAQAPSPRDIIDRAIAEYSDAMNAVNNKADAWSVDEVELTTTADTRRYDVTAIAPSFSKALAVVTVPSAVAGVIEPEVILEQSSLEQLPKEWAYLADVNWVWSLWADNVTQKGRFVAFYRQVANDGTGYKQYLEIRPTPEAGEKYRILYQVGNIQDRILPANAMSFVFPLPELDHYFLALIAKGVLYKCRWSDDVNSDRVRRQEIENQLVFDLTRYNKTYQEFTASLTQTQMLTAESYADFLGL